MGTGNGTALKSRETQYQFEVDLALRDGFSRFGIMSNQTWKDDPRRLVFLLSRYKFVAKMLTGQKRVVEVGCADAFGTRLVVQAGCTVTATDFDPLFLDDAKKRMAADGWACDTLVHDILSGPIAPGGFDAAYSLDVFEHIVPEQEDVYVGNIAKSLSADGVAIIGSPSLQSQAYASPPSKEGHVNCKDGNEYRQVMLRHFKNVFLFSMNDEVVHTGYHPMAHYLLAMCVGPR
ncbi:class I SAM-dependent methyltransferase [Urbifossiella limnaea]|uniref:Methyltransferase domain protein n=1 Tax=Urbifossiella limnaea TaxID=2528023 RepID=A0A517XQZ3_9BACT|nr:class I SAM-dependent methyltransferase [Urbifossiella limnaea]QDU19891.1 Methyltransferase domain protein [Urbifossiella limnaea]